MIMLIQRYATGRNAAIMFVLDLLMMLGLMPYMAARMEAVAGPIQPLDLEIPAYSPETAFRRLADLGEAGRSIYRAIELSADVIYPLVYGAAYALVIAWLWKRLAPGTRWALWLPLLPLLAMIFDFGENFSIVALIGRFPEQPETLARIAAGFSLLKWVFVLSAIAAMLTGLIGVGLKALNRKSIPAA